MLLDNGDEFGWPQEPLPVRPDETVLLPRLPRMITRLNALDRHARYRERKRLARDLAEL